MRRTVQIQRPINLHPRRLILDSRVQRHDRHRPNAEVGVVQNNAISSRQALHRARTRPNLLTPITRAPPILRHILILRQHRAAPTVPEQHHPLDIRLVPQPPHRVPHIHHHIFEVQIRHVPRLARRVVGAQHRVPPRRQLRARVERPVVLLGVHDHDGRRRGPEEGADGAAARGEVDGGGGGEGGGGGCGCGCGCGGAERAGCQGG